MDLSSLENVTKTRELHNQRQNQREAASQQIAQTTEQMVVDQQPEAQAQAQPEALQPENAQQEPEETKQDPAQEMQVDQQSEPIEEPNEDSIEWPSQQEPRESAQERAQRLAAQFKQAQARAQEGQEDAKMDEELCTVCYTSELSAEQTVRLNCGHEFHLACVKQLLEHRWSTVRISFAYLQCPQCKQNIRAQELIDDLRPHLDFKEEVERKMMDIAVSQGLDKDERVTSPESIYHGNLREFAAHACSFYQCFKCTKAFFGGLIDCQADLGVEQSTAKEDLLCKDCQLQEYGAGDAQCNEHGTKHIEWKCLFCCTIAVYFCYGTHYMCQRCHDEYVMPPKNHVELRDCGGQNCRLGIPHPPANPDYKLSTFPLGCSLCKSDKSKAPAKRSQIAEVALEPMTYQPKRIKEQLTETQRLILQKEREDRMKTAEEMREMDIANANEARRKQQERAKELRDLKLKERLEYHARDAAKILEPLRAAQAEEADNGEPKVMTAAEKRRIALIEKKAAIAKRKQEALTKMHEEQEKKIEQMQNRYATAEDPKMKAQRIKEFAAKQKREREERAKKILEQRKKQKADQAAQAQQQAAADPSSEPAQTTLAEESKEEREQPPAATEANGEAASFAMGTKM